MLNTTTKIIFTLTTFICSPLLQAKAYTPHNNDIVAKSSSLMKVELSIDEIEQLVFKSQNVGETERLQGVLKLRLAQRYKEQPSEQVGYLYARVLQKEHKFVEAIAIANKLLKQSTSNNQYVINTHLLLANMLMVKGDYEQAKQHCMAVIGKVSTLMASTCVIDIQSQQGQLKQSYNQLLKITNNKETNLYTAQVLSEMAYQLKDFSRALNHIEHIEIKNATVSLIVLWADIQLALGNNQLVLTRLTTLLADTDNLEDALLIRLAVAEKTTSSSYWKNLIAQRVELRELRKDTFHASDLAKYYLDVEPNIDKAIYWASINLQQAKMRSDKQLLMEAESRKERQ